METREGTYDKEVVKEQSKAYGFMDFKGHTIMDIGANIGAFAIFALEQGAERVICFEPEADNLEYLRKNASMHNVVIKRYAVMNVPTGDRNFYLNKGINKGAHSFFVKRGRDMTRVPCVNTYEVLEKYRPSFLKIDAEGSEYYMFDYKQPIPDYIKSIVLEAHFGKKDWVERKYPELLAYLVSNGFTITRQPEEIGKKWFAIIGGVRER